MDEDEDFRALFFSEARELLEQLLEHLNLLANNEGDADTVHAAFRAVHSVKGGAAAFGFDALIGFAHIFETVMDAVRAETLKLDEPLMQVLLRSGDIMQILVENAEAGIDTRVEGLERLEAELHQIAGRDPGEGLVADSDAAPTPGTPTDDWSVDETSPEPDEEALREVTVRITPEEAFFESGHDMLRLIRSARANGLTEVHVEGVVPTLGTFDPQVCPVTWELVFHTDSSVDDLREFFVIYGHIAQIELFGDGDDNRQDAFEVPEATAAHTGDTPDAELDPAPARDAAGSTDDGAGRKAVTPVAPQDLAFVDPHTDKAPPAPDPKPGSAQRGGGKAELAKSLRVEISRIDRLVNLVGEMLITQAGLAQQISEGEGQEATEMALSVETMSRQLRELQESVMAIRAQPVKSVFRRMPRVVRDLAEKLDKQARLDLFGEHTEVDATVIEELAEPLTHMIRNAMDHGLESNDERERIGKPRIGGIRLSAEHKGERVIITVEDDGRGVNRERVLEKALERGLVSREDQLSPEEVDMLIFHPGFSTAQEVSSVSGRGVGMDVVKKKITTLGGRFTMSSQPGKGTRFIITLPLTLAVMDGMTIGVGDQKYILPLSAVIEALNLSPETNKVLPDGSTLLERRGEYIKIVNLREALGLPPYEAASQMAIVVDTEVEGHVALVVDELIGQRQIVLKSLEANFQKIDGISGATILGDGQVALILDVAALIQRHQPAFAA